MGWLLLAESTLTAELARMLGAAVATIEGCTSASVTVVAAGRPRSAMVSDRVAVEVDVAQYVLDEGPCLDAARYGRPIRVNVVASYERFVHLAPLAARAGVRAILSAPVTVGGQTIGSLDVYSNTYGAFDRTSEETAAIFAAQTGAAIAKSRTMAAATEVARLAQQHSDDWTDIHVAQGMLAEVEGCGIEQAQGLLRATAGPERANLAGVARRIINYLTEAEAPT